MILLDITEAVAEDVLVAIGRHLPDYFELGRPRYVTADGLVTEDGDTTATFVLHDHGCQVFRTAQLPDGLWELTTWEYGSEVSRVVLPGKPDPGDGGGGGGDDDPGPYDGPAGAPGDPEFALLAADTGRVGYGPG